MRTESLRDLHKHFRRMNFLVLKDGWKVEAETQERLVESLQAQPFWRSGKPGKQVRFPKSVKINCKIESGTADLPYHPSHAFERSQTRAVPHRDSVYCNDVVNCRTHLRERRQSMVRQKREA